MKKFLLVLLIFTPVVTFAITPPAISGKNAIAIETNSGRILYEKDAFSTANIASTTKIMTAIVAIENNSLDEIVTISKNAANTPGSSVKLKENDTIKLSELLYGLMLNSGNDAAVAIAEHTAGSVSKFAELMNKKAIEIGALNTHFITPHGLDRDLHYSTAYDMAIIAKYALNNPTIQKLVSTQYYAMKFIDGKTTNLKNTNPLLSFYPGITGMKTGYTGLAGKCLVASAKRENLEIIVITLGEPSSKLRITDTVKILDYCFNNYKIYDLRELYPINFSINVKKAVNSSFVPIYSKELFLPLLEEERENMMIKRFVNKDLIAPIKANESVGRVQFKIGDEVLGELELYSPCKVERASLSQYYRIIWNTFLNFKEYLY